MAAGADCTHTLAAQTRELDIDEFIQFLEPQPERPDPDHPGQMLPARGGAMCQSADDWGKQKTALEQACKELGDRCTYEIRTMIRMIEAKIDALLAKEAALLNDPNFDQ